MWCSTARTQHKEASHSPPRSPALFSSALTRSLLHEGGNTCSCTSAQVFAKAPGAKSLRLGSTIVVKVLRQTLHHPCSSLCGAMSRAKHISILLCITEEQQKRGHTAVLMPARACGHSTPLSHGKRKPGTPFPQNSNWENTSS